MTQRESRLSRSIMKELRAAGVFCFKVHGSEYMMAGLNDIIACVDGAFFGFEVKNPGEKDETKPIQLYRHKQIRAAGGRAYVVSSVAEVMKIVREFREQKDCS
jgi:Holliday junction resolvase